VTNAEAPRQSLRGGALRGGLQPLGYKSLLLLVSSLEFLMMANR